MEDDAESDDGFAPQEVPIHSVSEEYCVYNTSVSPHPPITVPALLNNNSKPVNFQVDTGSGVSIINCR